MGELYDKPRAEVTEQEKAASLRYQIMDMVDQIRWIPEFGLKRELDWLRNMHDWMISKKRYWGLALPIWVCEGCDHHEVIGDEHELEERAVEGWDEFAGHSPHRPHIDAVKLACPECDGQMARIPDVGNPWLDAGIVSFSTLGYRHDNEYWQKWYPADWISESFPGQFRNWFYSMLVMGTVVDNSPSFKENFGYALLLAEDGREMHKSWGNSIEFNEAADVMGVDVMRWLYCAQKPENNLLFGYNRADKVRRQVLIPLWNVYSFLTTYANLDGWSPDWKDFDPAYPEGDAPKSENPLDRWIVARLNQVTARLTDQFENSDAYGATLTVEPFIDDLTNWYVRRSRRRFWKSEHDADKNMAYATLYHVLVKLVKLLAPIMPFATELIYQNLVAEQNPDAYGSLHHTLWPKVEETAIDEEFVAQMSLARQVASLGLSARGSAGLKVRQPLAKALVYTGDADSKLPDYLVEIVKDELNVKAVEFVTEAEKLVRYRILPNNAVLGPRFGADFPKVRAALEALDPVEVKRAVDAGESIEIKVGKKKFELAADEVLVNTEPAEGLAVAADKFVTVAVDAELTEELRQEGLAREFVRRVQDLRKQAEFEISDRIQVYYQASDTLASALDTHRDYIMGEVLATEMQAKAAPEGAYTPEETIEFGGERVEVGLVREG